MPGDSPYSGVSHERWIEKTKELVAAHPLGTKEIVEVVLEAWEGIFESTIGKKGFKIGTEIQPKPQMIGFFLHELISLEFETRYPGIWQAERAASDKDLVHLPDEVFSVEIKTSSNPSRIFGNRSYAQRARSSKKSKSGYYLAVNFQKFSPKTNTPRILRVRFGWLDDTDWIGQKAATGQQARLAPAVEQGKLLLLHSLK